MRSRASGGGDSGQQRSRSQQGGHAKRNVECNALRDTMSRLHVIHAACCAHIGDVAQHGHRGFRGAVHNPTRRCCSWMEPPDRP